MGRLIPIIGLHGWAYANDKWQPFQTLLHQAGFELTLLPIPGLTAPISQPWTLDDYVEWFHDEVVKLSSEPHIILGHSNGGRIALAFALKYPALVKQLILIDSAGVVHHDLVSVTKRTVFKTAAKIGKVFLNVPIAKKILYKLAREKDYLEAPPVMKKTMANLVASDLLPLVAQITAPVLLIWGENDKATPLQDAYQLRDHLPAAQLHTIATARHSPHFTHPEQVAKIIKEYLAKS